MSVIFAFVYTLTRMLSYVIFAHVIMSWLFQFGVISMSNDIVKRIWGILTSILEPFYRPIRRYVPPLGNIDSAPLVLLLIIFLVQSMIFGMR